MANTVAKLMAMRYAYDAQLASEHPIKQTPAEAPEETPKQVLNNEEVEPQVLPDGPQVLQTFNIHQNGSMKV